MSWLLANKPVLIGLHLGAAIIGIDAFLWLLGELFADRVHMVRARVAAVIGVLGFIGSWLFGGYYYLTYYGKLVKPAILKGTAPWAHSIAMEVKEHLFLLIIPLALTALLYTLLDAETFERYRVKKRLRLIVGFVAGLGLAIGLMGYVISAAVRWAS